LDAGQAHLEKVREFDSGYYQNPVSVMKCRLFASLQQERIAVKINKEREWTTLSFDLRDLVEEAKERFKIDGIYLFGSRRFHTRSLRSDIDIFFETTDYIKHSEIRDFIDETCIALDIFLLDRGRAVSAINESFIQFDDNAALLEATRAVQLWSKDKGVSSDSELQWVQRYADHIEFQKTVLPNIRLPMSVERLKDMLIQQGLPTDPIIGESEEEVAHQLIKIAQTIGDFRERDFQGKGSARSSFVVHPSNEYDFQDLFWIAAKPWLATMAREQVEVTFDGQKKKSDFSLMNSRFIVEMKFAKDENDKREIAKTLDGLSRFYRENVNVRFLLFIVYARKEADIDRTAWEARFSQKTAESQTILCVLEVP
jgi:predicted nucleotidyltransferase